jgi:hypothetical protein
MSPTKSAELSLINDTEFLGELQKFEPEKPPTPDPSLDPQPIYADAFDSLESGLPIDAGAPEIVTPYSEQQPEANPYDDPAPPARAERDIPMVAAALVIIACLAAGAATAVFVFNDRVATISATLPASR